MKDNGRFGFTFFLSPPLALKLRGEIKRKKGKGKYRKYYIYQYIIIISLIFLSFTHAHACLFLCLFPACVCEGGVNGKKGSSPVRWDLGEVV